MSFSPTDVNGMPQERFDNKQQFQLTPEEQRILRECSREGIYQRALPLGVLFGLGGLLGARAGPLMHSKLGVKPAVISLGIIGYFIGRFSYGKVCIRRALEVPNGNLRKMFPHLQQGGFVESPDAFYAAIDVPKTQDPYKRAAQSSGTDIDVAGTGSFDTIPSEYYDTNVERSMEPAEAKNYASYDDLRKQNRQEYTKKFYPEANQSQQRYAANPQDGPVVRRPTPQETQQSGVIGSQGKYGDTWDA